MIGATMERKLSSLTKFVGKVFSVTVDEIIDCEGNQTIREVIHHSGGVCVYAEVDDQVLLVKQFRYPFGKELLELPAGKLNVGEDPYQAAMRELVEETGYMAQRLVDMGTFLPTCAYDTEIIYLYRAEGLSFVGQQLDEGEHLTVLRKSVGELKTLINSNALVDGKTLCLLMKVWMKEG
jgi:ADP-ribose pyrophosphatase